MGLNKRTSNKLLQGKSNGRSSPEHNSKASRNTIFQNSSRRERRSCSQKVFVQHKYKDHLGDPLFHSVISGQEQTEPRRSQPNTTFPEMLHSLLTTAEVNGFGDVVSWQPHGRSFLVHKKKIFVEEIIPRFFHQTKLTSFQRQLNLYGFVRLTTGPDRSGYYHELFLRGRPDLCKQMVRTRIKGNGMKAASSPSTEPNFYKMKFCAPESDSCQSSDKSAADNGVDSMNEHDSTRDLSEHEDDEASVSEKDELNFCGSTGNTSSQPKLGISPTLEEKAAEDCKIASMTRDPYARKSSVVSHSDSSTCSGRGSDSGYSSTGDDAGKEGHTLVPSNNRSLLSVLGPSVSFSHFRSYASSSSLSTDGVQQLAPSKHLSTWCSDPSQRNESECTDCVELDGDSNRRFQNGDVVYFEGHKFRYLDHLAVDELVDLIVGMQHAEGGHGSDLGII